MKPVLTAAVFLATLVPLAANAQSAVPATIPEGGKVTPLTRTTLWVRDQQESLKLYRDILGLKITADRLMDNPAMNGIGGLAGSNIKFMILKSGDSTTGNLGLFEVVGGTAASAPSTETKARPGDVAVVFNTNDIDGIAAQVKAAGYTIISMPTALPNPNQLAVPPKEMMFRDHDGVIVNLFQVGKAK